MEYEKVGDVISISLERVMASWLDGKYLTLKLPVPVAEKFGKILIKYL